MGSIQPRCNCAKTIRSHFHHCQYCQVLIYTAWQRFEATAVGFEIGFSRLRIRPSNRYAITPVLLVLCGIQNVEFKLLPHRIVSYELNMVYLEYLHQHEYIHENIHLLLEGTVRIRIIEVWFYLKCITYVLVNAAYIVLLNL